MDVLLDPDTWDLTDGTTHVSGVELIKQKIFIRLNTFAGEWPLRRQAGVPYFGFIGQKPFRTESLAALIRREIQQVDGVRRVRNLTARLDANTETIHLHGEIEVEDDGAVVLTLDSRFMAEDANHHPFISVVWRRHNA